MTTTMSRVNGRPRSTLAGQIDRLDEILDGLGEALTQAVADAVKEAVQAAAADLTRRPELLRPAADPQSLPATPTWRERLRRIAGRAASFVYDALARAARAVRGTGASLRAMAGPIRPGARSAGVGTAAVPIACAGYRAGIENCWRRHRPTVLAVAVVLLVGAACVLAGPFAAFLACGGLAVVLAASAREGLVGRHPPGARWPDSPGDCVRQLSVGGPEYWI